MASAQDTSRPASTPGIFSREIRREGFSEIYNGLGKPESDVVIVHGLQGDPVKTWTCEVQTRSNTTDHASTKSKKFLAFHRKPRENGGNAPEPTLEAQTIGNYKESTYWPSDLLPRDFPNARVLTYGYDSHVSHFFRDTASQNNIIRLGEDLLNNLVAYRVDEPTRPLFFVCHSLGGLVVKEALRRSANASDIDTDLLNILESTFALIFFGTPHRGGNYTYMGLTAARIVSAAGFLLNFQHLRDLSGDSGILELLREEFGKLLDRGAFLITSFQEGKGFTRHGLLDGKIVEYESSGLDHKFERKHTIQRNQVDMCRFAGADDEGYRQFKEELKRHITRMGHNRAQELRSM